ncbi:MAG TPA: hypothetical protein VNP04_15445 [Alphaproteobacteria bacterium]|nr:hypothetical protein [Alphaproteobacteria bacterium]
MPVNFQTVTLNASGVLTLTGSTDGGGVYRVNTNGGVASQQLTSISGGQAGAIITLQPNVSGQYFFLNHSASHVLQDEQRFQPLTVNDSITLRLDTGGTVWRELFRTLTDEGSTAPRTITIAAGVLALQGSGMYQIAPESGTSDTVTQITGLGWGRAWLRVANPTHTITIQHNAPNIRLAQGAGNFDMTGYDWFVALGIGSNQITEGGRLAIQAT